MPDDEPRLIIETSGKMLRRATSFASSRTDDPDTEAAPGEVGQIGGRGAALMLGYFDDQAATEDAFNKSGWFMTGDLGSIDAQGYLRIAGRSKDIIIRGGHNIHPARIEELATRHPAVLAQGKADAFFTCGSNRLLKLMQRLGKKHNIPGQVAMEQIMVCGFGACYVCMRTFEVDGKRVLRRVCRDGPVFNMQEAVGW